MRLVDVPDEAIKWLDRCAVEQGTSRAALVREAVRGLRTRERHDWIARGAGYRKDRDDIGDPVEYQRAMRPDRGSC